MLYILYEHIFALYLYNINFVNIGLLHRYTYPKGKGNIQGIKGGKEQGMTNRGGKTQAKGKGKGKNKSGKSQNSIARYSESCLLPLSIKRCFEFARAFSHAGGRTTPKPSPAIRA